MQISKIEAQETIEQAQEHCDGMFMVCAQGNSVVDIRASFATREVDMSGKTMLCTSEVYTVTLYRRVDDSEPLEIFYPNDLHKIPSGSDFDKMYYVEGQQFFDERTSAFACAGLYASLENVGF